MQPLFPDDIWLFNNAPQKEHMDQLIDALTDAREIIALATKEAKKQNKSPEWLESAEEFLEKIVLTND